MREEHTENLTQSPQHAATAGETLRAARVARNLEIDDICSYLRLSQRQVEALENNDFAALPEPTIARGFIRNYARMLDLDAAPLLAEYQRSDAAVKQLKPAISMPTANILISNNAGRRWRFYIWASILILIAVGAWVIYVDYVPKGQHPSALEYAPTETEILAAEAVEPAAAPEAAEIVADNRPPATDQDTGAAGAQALAIEQSELDVESASTVAGEQATVRLGASARSWVRITDHDNNNIFDKMLIPGVDETIRGQPPLRVVIGNAPDTTLIFNGQTIDLTTSTTGRVARLKLE